MADEIEKSKQPNPDEVLAAIQSFNDPAIITNLFRELGWNYTVEIKETLSLARQNANLSIKFKAIKHLRELLRDAAESSGYVANVSMTAPNTQGGYITFHAKRIAGALNPTKKIESTEIKELQNDEKETRTEPNRESNRGQSQAETTSPESDSPESVRDTGRAFPIGDSESGGVESQDGAEASGAVAGGETSRNSSTKENESWGQKNNNIDSGNSNPCIQTRPPTCDHDLFPGISSAED